MIINRIKQFACFTLGYYCDIPWYMKYDIIIPVMSLLAVGLLVTPLSPVIFVTQTITAGVYFTLQASMVQTTIVALVLECLVYILIILSLLVLLWLCIRSACYIYTRISITNHNNDEVINKDIKILKVMHELENMQNKLNKNININKIKKDENELSYIGKIIQYIQCITLVIKRIIKCKCIRVLLWLFGYCFKGLCSLCKMVNKIYIKGTAAVAEIEIAVNNAAEIGLNAAGITAANEPPTDVIDLPFNLNFNDVSPVEFDMEQFRQQIQQEIHEEIAQVNAIQIDKIDVKPPPIEVYTYTDRGEFKFDYVKDIISSDINAFPISWEFEDKERTSNKSNMKEKVAAYCGCRKCYDKGKLKNDKLQEINAFSIQLKEEQKKDVPDQNKVDEYTNEIVNIKMDISNYQSGHLPIGLALNEIYKLTFDANDDEIAILHKRDIITTVIDHYTNKMNTISPNAIESLTKVLKYAPDILNIYTPNYVVNNKLAPVIINDAAHTQMQTKLLNELTSASNKIPKWNQKCNFYLWFKDVFIAINKYESRITSQTMYDYVLVTLNDRYGKR